MQLLGIPENIINDIRRYHEYREKIIQQYQPHIRAITEAMNSPFIQQAIEASRKVQEIYQECFKRFGWNNYGQSTSPIGAVDDKEKPRLQYYSQQVRVLPKCFIYREGSKIFCRGKEIYFKSLKSISLLLLFALLEKSGRDGFCSYETIDGYFVAAGEKKIRDKKRAKKRILNAYHRLLRQRERSIDPFPTKTPDGSPVIRVRWGEGFILNNPVA